MSTAGHGSKGKGNGAPPIPATAKKMVESLKEIVNCPEHEIYAMLKECNMDPNDTVSRLLSQDPFHEVKSKREKKKESKDGSESRSRVTSAPSARGGRSGTERNVGRSGTSQFVSNEPGGLRGRPALKKENGSMLQTSLPFGTGVSGSNANHRSISLSDSLPAESSGQVPPLPFQPSGYHSAWAGLPGQLSMAEIVKRGRPQSKPSSVPFPNSVQQNADYPPISAPIPSESSYENSSQRPDSEVHVTHEPAVVAIGSSSEPDTSVYLDPSSVASVQDKTTSHLNSPLDEVQPSEQNFTVENQVAALSLERHIQPGDSYHSQGLAFDEGNQESSHLSISDCNAPSSVEEANVIVSSTIGNLQKLSLQKEEIVSFSSRAEDNPAVIIPNHLQVPSADSSHFSFGSFGSGMNETFTASFSSKAVKSNLEESRITAEANPIEHPDARSSEYYGNDQGRPLNESTEAPSSSQTEVLKQEPAPEPAEGHHYPFSTSMPGYGFENTAPSHAASDSFPQANSHMQNLAPFSSVMLPYTGVTEGTLLASTVQPGRETDIPYSSLLSTQLPTKYSRAMSSISGTTMSMPESMKPSANILSSMLSSTNIATGPALHHLPVHHYSQPTLPLGHFPNMIGYPLPPQSYTFLPFAAASGNAIHQAPGSVHSSSGMKYTLPSYKSSGSVSSIPHSPAMASGYGAGFGGSTTIPGNFSLAPSSTPGSTISYEDVVSTQFKDSNHFVPLQQNEGSAMWLSGPGSRTMTALPASTYYSFQGQNQPPGFRQGQQAPSPYGALGYPNIYNSQVGASQEHHQTPGDSTLSTSQSPSSQPFLKLWQHNY